MLKSQDLKKYHLPDSPGVYFFRAGNNNIYIGKATSLKDRVKSYFSNDLISTRGPLMVDMLYRANKIAYIKTESVLEAIILEANLIKKYQPKYNTKEKDDTSFNYVVITKEDFPRVMIVRGREIEQGLNYDIKTKFGPFTDGESLKIVLKIIRKIFPFRDRCLPLSGKACFNKQIKLCPGVCNGTINKKEYSKIIEKIILLFSGKITKLKSSLKKEMISCVAKQEFEKAAEVRRTISALDHIQDVALIRSEQVNHRGLFRIEAYDVAHLSGTSNVGVMVVVENGKPKKSDYRKFIIRNSRGNDVGALKEILERRFRHLEWPIPNLIVVDGGPAQLNAARQVTNMVNRNILLIAVTKNDQHKPKAIIGDESIIKKYKKEILLINNEAHRFAIAFHRQKRNVIL